MPTSVSSPGISPTPVAQVRDVLSQVSSPLPDEPGGKYVVGQFDCDRFSSTSSTSTVEQVPSLHDLEMPVRLKSSWVSPTSPPAGLAVTPLYRSMYKVLTVFMTLLAIVQGSAIALAQHYNMQENSDEHLVMAGVLGSCALLNWGFYFYKKISYKTVKIISLINYTAVSWTCHVTYKEPAKSGQIQSTLLMLIAPLTDAYMSLGLVASTIGAWVFGILRSSEYTMASTFTPFIISLMACGYPLCKQIFFPRETYLQRKANCESPGSSRRSHKSATDDMSADFAADPPIELDQMSHSKPSQQSSSDAAFFVAPMETIARGLTACRPSVGDGMIYREEEMNPWSASIAATSSDDKDPGRHLSLREKELNKISVCVPNSGPETKRSYSLTSSHHSLLSDKSSGSSYVSFNPTLKRGNDGTSFAQPKKSYDYGDAPIEDSSESQSLGSAHDMEGNDPPFQWQIPSQSQQAQSFSNIGARQESTEDVVLEELKRNMTPAKKSDRYGKKPAANYRKFSVGFLTRRKSVSPVPSPNGGPGTLFPGQEKLLSPNRLSAPAVSGKLEAGYSISSLKSAEENKKDATETMEIVKSVVQLDFNEPQSPVIRRQLNIPFRNLSTSTLQKLVVLFTRLSEELDTYRVQRFICACVVQVIQCEKASIFLCEWKRQEIWTISDEGHEIRVPMNGSLAGYAAVNNEVLNIADAYRDTRFNKEVDKNTGYITRNLLVYPISRGVGYIPNTRDDESSKNSNVIAVVEAINKTNGEFTSEDEGILALLGKQAGIHLANAQIYQQLQVEGTKTNSLLEVSKEINDVQQNLGAIMAKIMSRARQVLLVERASIFLVDDQKNELWSILTDSETAAQLGGDNVIRLPVGVGLAGHVAVTGNVLNIPDAYACELFNPEFDRKTGFVTKATLCVPVKPQHANKVMGVIQFINKFNGEPFNDGDVELALSFSSFVGISLNNILLYDELREGQFIREKNKHLKQAAEAKSNFLMSMSHEIRTPMSGVIGMCELIMNTQLTGEQKEMADTIKSCGEALMAIINDVLDYGRLDAGKLELEQRPFELVNIIEETIDVIRPKTEAKDITLMVDVDPASHTEVIGDVYRLRQILTNLLGNAVKFTPNLGDISLLVKLKAITAGSVTIYFSVTDTGIGIEEEAQQKLFKPFEQADAGTTRQYGGSGLGLAICKQLVEAMGGEIGIESAPAKGSTFWFTAGFKTVENVVSVSESIQKIANNALGQTIVLACSHPVHRGILTRLMHVVRCKCWIVCSYKDLNILITKLIRGRKELQKSGGSISRSITAIPAPDEPAYIPDGILIDEDLTGFGMDQLEDVRHHLARLSSIPELHLLMTMSSKTMVVDKSYSIITKPPKMSLIASLFADLSSSIAPGNVKVDSHTLRETSKKLLVAEDNATNQLLIKKQLAQFGITPTICSNGQEAVDALQESRYDLVFMDCHMPVLDGYGAVKEIRKLELEGTLSKDLPPIIIIALTADALPHTRGLCVEAGMNDYITKPLRKNTLKNVLDEYFFE